MNGKQVLAGFEKVVFIIKKAIEKKTGPSAGRISGAEGTGEAMGNRSCYFMLDCGRNSNGRCTM